MAGKGKSGRGAREKYPLPYDTASFVSGRGMELITNPGLLYERFGPYKAGRDHEWEMGAQEKGKVLRAVAEILNGASGDYMGMLDGFSKRWRAMLDYVNAKTFTARPKWRFVTGLGKGGPLEVGFVFHRIYGFPIIPGSSLKGMTRAYAELVLGIGEDKMEKVFGKQDDAGCVIFFDAVPNGRVKLELDIMNPHYPKYYQGDEPPADWQSPVPIPFLTVGSGTEFIFAIAARRGCKVNLQEVSDWMQQALEEIGAGAKTTAGYGYFAYFKGAGG